MSHIFQLKPNLDLLEQYGYEFIPALEVEDIYTTESRLELERKFRAVLKKHGIEDHYETLFYISLIGSIDASTKYYYAYDAYLSAKRTKQLAALLNTLKHTDNKRIQKLTLQTLSGQEVLDDKILIAWIGEVLSLAMINKGHSTLGDAVFKLIKNPPSATNQSIELNYEAIGKLANARLIKPYKLRTKLISDFLLRIRQYIQEQTAIKKSTDVRFSDSQMKLLYDIGSVLGWINDDAIESEPKDYMYSLLKSQSER